MRLAPRSRARSSASDTSASPTPARRACSRTKRSSSQASGAALQMLKRKRSCRTPAGAESSSGVASRNSVSRSSSRRSTDARNAFADGQSRLRWSRNSTSRPAIASASSGCATQARAVLITARTLDAAPAGGRGLLGVADDSERVAVGDRVALGDRQLGDDPCLVGRDLVLHLHRLDDRDDVALGHLLAGLHRYLPDAALHRRSERVAVGRAAAAGAPPGPRAPGGWGAGRGAAAGPPAG